MSDFTAMGLPHTLLDALKKIGFLTPTSVQAKAIPFALQGRDVLGSAATGTGKTGAFAIPMVARLINAAQGSALVMTPTRELAQQVMATIHPLLLKHPEIKTALLIGGEAMPRQYQQLRLKPRIVVGTPGRINDHLQRGTLVLKDTNFLVLDETDRMLDMGFGIQIDKIIQHLAKPRQTLMFSATIAPAISKLSAKYLLNPERVSVNEAHKPAALIKQEQVHTTDAKKYEQLLAELTAREGSVIIFVKTKYGTERLADKLCKGGHKADAIHGDLQQRKRERVIRAFRDKEYRVLVATDVAARGLDIPHIEHVINYDLPQAPEDYIHRIGRTARAGASGCAVTLITPADAGKWRAIYNLMHPDEARKDGGERRGGGDRSGGGGRDYSKSRRKSHGDFKGGFKGGYRNDKDRDGRKEGGRQEERGDRPATDRVREDKPREFKPREDRPRGDRPFGDKPRDGVKSGGGDKKPFFGKKRFGNKKEGGAASGGGFKGASTGRGSRRSGAR